MFTKDNWMTNVKIFYNNLWIPPFLQVIMNAKNVLSTPCEVCALSYLG